MAAALGYLSVCNMDSVSFRLLSGTHCTELCARISGRESFLRAGEKLDALQYGGRPTCMRASETIRIPVRTTAWRLFSPIC